MDAQEITFNQDPEAGATDIEETNSKNGCCCKILCCPFNVFYWYIAPLTCEFCHTLKCWLFHPLNFAAAIFFIVWDCTMLSVGIGIIPLCCMGIPFLWITVELIVAFSRIDLGFHYYFVENGKKLDESKKHLVNKLSVYFTELPLCCCYSNSNEYGNCMNLMFERMKNLFTNIEIYKYIFYHILVRGIITFSTWWIMILVAVNVGICGTPFWYLADDTLFKRNQVVIGWTFKDGHCNWEDVYDSNGDVDYETLVCDKDYFWIINTFGRTVGLAILSLLILPLTMRLNNYFAYLNKVGAYYFYTCYYTKDYQKLQDKAPMLDNTARIDSV